MFKIQIRSNVFVHRVASGRMVRNAKKLSKIDGFRWDEEELSTYLGDGIPGKNLTDLGVTGGSLYLTHEEIAKINFVAIFTEFVSPVELNSEQLEELKEYTKGQWTDGGGPAFALSFEEKFKLIPGMMGFNNVHIEQEKTN